MDPEELAGQTDPTASTATPETPPTPAPAAPPTAPAPAPSPAPSATTVSGGTPASTATTPAVQSFRDRARAHGVDLSHLADDTAAESYLFEHLRKVDSYRQYGEQLAPHYSDFVRYLDTLRNPTPAAGAAPTTAAGGTAAAANPFGLPSYDPNWLNQVTRDDQGNIVARPGVPPDVPAKLMAYTNALRGAQEKFFQDPAAALAPIIQAAVAPMLREQLQTNIGAVQDSQFADSWINQNTSWLHLRNPAGQVLVDPFTQKPALSPDGQAFVQHLANAEKMGIGQLAQQTDYAVAMVTRDRALRQLNGGATPPAPGAAPVNGFAQAQAEANARFLAQHAGYRPNNGSGQTAPATDPANPPPSNVKMSLADRLRKNLKAGGVTDASLANETQAV